MEFEVGHLYVFNFVSWCGPLLFLGYRAGSIDGRKYSDSIFKELGTSEIYEFAGQLDDLIPFEQSSFLDGTRESIN